jgi:hypothetical protein
LASLCQNGLLGACAKTPNRHNSMKNLYPTYRNLSAMFHVVTAIALLYCHVHTLEVVDEFVINRNDSLFCCEGTPLKVSKNAW